jgi:hypothetical protein
VTCIQALSFGEQSIGALQNTNNIYNIFRFYDDDSMTIVFGAIVAAVAAAATTLSV